MLEYVYISDQGSFDALVAQYSNAPLLVLDTEFVRTRTYYAKLGLIQAYDGQTLALIDPLAVKDLSGFWALLQDPNIIKLVHSCSEDLEVFAHYGQCQPAPLFDSQLAAAFAGMGHGLGYAKLVQACLGVELDKGESRTDWLKRPLSQAQLQYAANDVYYLYQLYPQLLSALNDKQRLTWLWEEGQRLTQDRLTPLDPALAYLKVKNAFQLSSEELAVLRDLAAWRLQRAIDRDLALGFVVKDHVLLALAKKQPKSLEGLMRMVELSEHEKRVLGQELLKIIAAVDFTSCPEPIDILALQPGYKPAFKAIKAALVSVCEQYQVPDELLSSKRHIHEYLTWHWHDQQGELPLLLVGWRGELSHQLLQQLGVSFVK
ncbi:ribonuclease D [Shewanella sp. NIFS-20-20]|uniref:ribonuclease D n=1 Tax=Shewanella sp. NIFS-20-20 TaxID=2853806 RepID=UPI001C464AB3|nr:ribonuclease D [Shewanella sp. NIFS-20-20]MBV7314416.1 ribonuclease D [Shewanella sp. NIFS-20-20]